MKKLLLHGAITSFLGLAMASMSAQTQTTDSSTTYIQASKVVGTKVKSSDGQEVGTIKDVVLDRNTGCMAYTVVSSVGGGANAGGSKMVAVPWAVYSPTSNLSELTVTVDRERIYNAPAFDNARIDEYSRPDYITNVYSYYGVSPSAAIGVGASGSTTSGATSTTGASVGTGAAAGTSTRTGTNSAETASRPGAASRGTNAPRTTSGTQADTQRATTAGRKHAPGSQGTTDEERMTSRAGKERGERDRSEESAPPNGRGTSESAAENERSQPERSGQDEGGTAARESRPEAGRSRPEGESRPETEQSRPEGESRPETNRSRSEGAAQDQTQTGTHHRERTRKHETSSPSERPGGE